MKFARLFGLAVVLSAGFIFSSFADDERIQYMEVKHPFLNIYVEMNPKSDIIRQTRKGEYLELLTIGDSWCKVTVDGRIGYLETKAGKVVSRQGASVVMRLLYVILLLGGAIGVVYYVRKQQQALTK